MFMAAATSGPSVTPNVSTANSASQATLSNGTDETRHISHVLVNGLRRSGKTSILEVMFKQCPAKNTFFLDPTTRILKSRVDSVIPLEFWDCPGNLPLASVPLELFSTLLFVIDIQDKFTYAIPRLTETILTICQINADINVEVFVHKADALTEDYKDETFRHVQHLVIDELLDMNVDVEMLGLNFHLTSIYDHSIYESISKVVQKLIDPGPLPYLEDLLNVFTANSRLSKAFLFDTKSRIYVATDASPVDGATHDLCCDYVHMLSQFAPLYRDTKEQEPNDPSRWSCSSVRLNPDTTVAFWQITNKLAVVVLLPSEIYNTRRGLIEYNLVFFKEGVQEILEVDSAERSTWSTGSTKPT